MVDIDRVVTLDELMDRVPEHLVKDAESRLDYDEPEPYSPTDMSYDMSDLSKAQRIRNYLDTHPEVRNKDIVSALEKYGVKAADVANVKSQMKKADTSAEPTKKPSKSSASHSSDSGPSLNLKHLEAAVDFVALVGSVQAAQHLLIIVDRVKGA
ncbi:MAG: hypothetical protein ACK56W_08625 [Pirellula sp.]|jgi:hypothetical protein|nr:hypothetical protein [Pirellula sp.]